MTTPLKKLERRVIQLERTVAILNKVMTNEVGFLNENVKKYEDLKLSNELENELRNEWCENDIPSLLKEQVS